MSSERMRWFLICSLLCFTNGELQKKTEQRITGGTTAGEGENPHAVFLRTKAGGFMCTSSIIGPKWLLTSAYCIYGKVPADVVAIAGTIFLSSGGSKHEVSSLIPHPAYGAIPFDFINMDIGLVKLLQGIFNTPFSQPIKLNSNFISDGFPGVVCGWGAASKDNDSPSDALKCSHYRSITSFTCKILRFPSIVSASKLCALPSMYSGICSKDTGSPLVSNGILIGIASNSAECGKRTPHLFARVSYFYPWIKKITSSY